MNILYNLDDNELITLIKENNDDEFLEILMRKYKPLVISKASKYLNSKFCDFEDYVQEARLGLLKAVNGYSLDYNVPFFAFASICIERRLISYYKKSQNSKNIYINESISLNNEDNKDQIEAKYTVNSVEINYFDEQETKEIKEKIINLLSALEKSIFEDKVFGYSNKEICMRNKITPSVYKNALYRIRQKSKNIK